MAVAIVPISTEQEWPATLTGTVLSAFFMGYLAFQLPAGWLAHRLGPRRLIGYALLAWSAMTLLTPVAASTSFGILVLTRFLMGAGEAGMFPGAYALFGQWVPASERTRSVGLLFSAIPLGTLVALSASGWLAANHGWSAIFYLFGAIGVVFAYLWFALMPHDKPADTARSRSEASQTSAQVWRVLLSSRAVWALIANSFATSWSIYVLLSWTPLYLKQVHQVTLGNIGLLAAAPWIVMFAITNLAAWSADAWIARGVPAGRVRKAMQCVGLLGTALFLFALPQTSTATEATLLLCGALGANALTMSGFAPNHLELAPDHASLLNAMTNCAGTLPGIVGVFITGWIIERTGQYDAAFALAGAISITGALLWAAFSSSERLPALQPSDA